MKKLVISYELTLLAKEKGFNEPCLAVIYIDGLIHFGSHEFVEIMVKKLTDCLPCPLYQQIIDWYFDKHGETIEYRPYNRVKMDNEIRVMLERLPNI